MNRYFLEISEEQYNYFSNQQVRSYVNKPCGIEIKTADIQLSYWPDYKILAFRENEAVTIDRTKEVTDEQN